MNDEHRAHEDLVASLAEPAAFAEYKAAGEGYRPTLLPRLIAGLLIWCGDMVYGKEPSYLKFRAIEVVARVPYHAWSSAMFTLLTLFYGDEQRALRLSTLARFTRFAADNETMHVVVVSQLARKHARAGVVMHSVIPVLFAFIYFWKAYLLYLINPRWSLEVNYIFEQHAYEQYSRFLELYGDKLKERPIESEFLAWYGRHPRSQHEFFSSVRIDELVHRNRSVREIHLHAQRGA